MDRREAIKDADFVVCMVQIGGFNSTLVDFEIPRKYGLNFTIADTTGPGGLFRALRTFPLMRDLARDIAEVAKPDCWLLNYSNPMSMNMKSLFHTSGERATGRNGINAVGLCHSVQGTFNDRMRNIDVEPEEAIFECSGINHMNFYTKLQHKDGRDLYPDLFAIAEERVAKRQGQGSLRADEVDSAYCVTESSEHNAEYCAHFMPHEGMIEKFDIPIDEYLRRCDGIVDEFERLADLRQRRRADGAGEDQEEPRVRQRHRQLASSRANRAVVYGNMLNDGAIPNLPATAIVETPTLVDANGCRLTRVGPMEYQLLNYVMPHVCQHELFIEAAIDGRRDKVYQAAIADPLTAATMPMDKIVEMCDELIVAHGMEQDGGVLPNLDATRSAAFRPAARPSTRRRRSRSEQAGKKPRSTPATRRSCPSGTFARNPPRKPAFRPLQTAMRRPGRRCQSAMTTTLIFVPQTGSPSSLMPNSRAFTIARPPCVFEPTGGVP